MSDSTTAEHEPGSDVTIESAHLPADANRDLRWGAYLMVVSGIGFVVNGIAILYREFYTANFEAGVTTLDGVTRSELAATNPEIAHYIGHLHVNVAGLLVTVGIAMIALAWYGIRRGEQWAGATAIVTPVVFLVHTLPIHQITGFSFDSVAHLGPGLVWLPALIAGAVLSYRGLQAVDHSPE